MRLDVLKFSGDGLDKWILSITEYFSLLSTPVDQRLRIVGFNLEGVVTEWFQWISRNGWITSWERFVESVKSCFIPSKYEDPQGALSKLLQLGLKLNLQHEFLVSRPTMLGDAFSLASPLDASEDTLLSLRSKDPNFKIQEKGVKYVRALNVAPFKVVFAGPVDEGPLKGEKGVKYVRALNVAPFKVVFAGPVDEVCSVIEYAFGIDESNVEGLQERGMLRPGQRKSEEGKERSVMSKVTEGEKGKRLLVAIAEGGS
nr:retrotransposon-related protein [Tanacetum cinerariifolium]